MNMSDCPCTKHCPNRTAECHAYCKEYNEWRNERNEEIRKNLAIAMSKDTISEANKKRMWRKKTKSKNKRSQNGVGNY